MRYNENNCMIKICKISIFIYKKLSKFKIKKSYIEFTYLGIHYERQSSTLVDDRRDRNRKLVSEETDHRENYEAGEKGRADVADGDDQRILVAIVGEFVVGAERYQTAPSGAQGEEYLHSGVAPHFRGHQPFPIGC